MRHASSWMLFALTVAWCSGCSRSALQPPAHPGGPDLSQVTRVEGIVYRADSSELMLYTASAALRFKLTPASSKLVWKGKQLADLRPGDNVQVDVHYAGADQGMTIDSFSLKSMAPSGKENPHMAHPHGLNPQSTKNKGEQP